jgi:hypothetical protein
MVIISQKYLPGAAAVFIIIIACTGFFILSVKSQNTGFISSSYDTPLGPVSINAKLPESPSSITLYQVVPSKNDMAFFSVDNLLEGGPNIPSESEAPIATETALLPYGGLPAGANLTFVKTEYIETLDLDTHRVIEREPISTNVQYRRYIDDKPVVGDGGSIYLDLGNNGELIYLNKVWRTVTPAGNVSIIPISAAIEKMKRGELLGHQPKCACQLNVDKIGLGYYEKGRDEPQEYIEPVWIFSGTLSTGDTWNYYVYARASADSSVTPAPGSGEPKITTASQIQSKNYLILSLDPDEIPNTTVNNGNDSGQ